MKKGKQIIFKINLSNRLAYTLIILGILALISVGVYAYNTGSPTTSGHTWNEIAGIPAGFADGVDDIGTSGPIVGGLYGYGRIYSTYNQCFDPIEPIYDTGSNLKCRCRAGYTLISTGTVSTSGATTMSCVKT